MRLLWPVLAGGSPGHVDGVGTAAKFSVQTRAIAYDEFGLDTLYITDNVVIRAVTISTANVVTVAGVQGAVGNTNGIGAAARFTTPGGIAIDFLAANVYIAQGNNCIRAMTVPGFDVTTPAGTPGTIGYVDATGAAARFNFGVNPDMTIGFDGNIYVVDFNNFAIRKITPAGVVTTLAGNGTPGQVDGTGTAARFRNINSITCGGDGNLYVTDQWDPSLSVLTVRRITLAGVVTTLTFVDSTMSARGISAIMGSAFDLQHLYLHEFATTNLFRLPIPAGTVLEALPITGLPTASPSFGFVSAGLGQLYALNTDGASTSTVIQSAPVPPVLDTTLLNEIQYHLIETPNGGQSLSSELWTTGELCEAIDQAQLWLIRESQLLMTQSDIALGTSTNRFALPSDWLMTRRVTFRGAAITKELPRESVWSAQQGQANWESTPQTAPIAYTDHDAPYAQLELLPGTTDATADATVTYVPRPTALCNGGADPDVPICTTHILKWRAIAILLAKEGRGQDLLRAQLAQNYAEIGLEAVKVMLRGL